MKMESVSVLGVNVARMSTVEVLEWIRVMIGQKKPRHIVTANAEIIYKAHTEPDFGALLERADLVTADGAGVVLAARLLGSPVPERVAGADLTMALLAMAEEKGWTVYLLGADPETLEKAVLNTLSKHPRLRISGYHHGYYSQQETTGVVSNINKVKPDILLAALGAPKQEEFIQQNMKELNVPVSIGVGGTFDILAGTAQRAPAWMQKTGLEWLYRLGKKPSRAKRMLALPRFVLAVLVQKVSRRKGLKQSK